MASLRYRCLHAAPKTKEYPVAASQYFYHDGVNAVYLDASGNVALGLTATGTLLGFAEVPKGPGAGTSTAYWLSSATAGADKIDVIKAEYGYSFVLPSDATIAASDKGNSCDIIAINDGTATVVDPDASATKVFIIEDLATNVVAGAAVTDVVVKFNLAKVQAD